MAKALFATVTILVLLGSLSAVASAFVSESAYSLEVGSVKTAYSRVNFVFDDISSDLTGLSNMTAESGRVYLSALSEYSKFYPEGFIRGPTLVVEDRVAGIRRVMV